MNIGRKIKRLRELKHFSQEYMAEKLNMKTQSSYSKLEASNDVPYSKLEQIASLLGVKPEDIITFNEGMVFNLMNNKKASGLVINNQLPKNERKIYDEYIVSLRKEIEHLKIMVDKLLPKK